MVYKKYIKRNGKTFGPYYYESFRVGDKVKKRYIGTINPESKRVGGIINNVGKSYPTSQINKKYHLLTIVGVLFIAALMTLLLINGFGGLSGNAIAEMGSDSFIIKLSPGELLPTNTIIEITQENKTTTIPINTLISQEKNLPIQGQYFIDGTNIQGTGEAYGKPIIINNYPIVYFEIRIIKDQEPETNNEQPSNPQNNEPSETTSPEPEKLPELLETGPATEEQGETAPVEEESGRGLITGLAILNSPEKIVGGAVRSGEEYVYHLESGERAELVQNSVRTVNKQLNDEQAHFSQVGRDIVFVTDYYEKEEVLGKEYYESVKNGSIIEEEQEDYEIIIPYEKLALEEGRIKIKVSYNGEIITEMEGNYNEPTIIIAPITAPETKKEKNDESKEEKGNVESINQSGISIKTEQERVRVGMPVRWTKTIVAENPTNITITLPSETISASIKKVHDGEETGQFDIVKKGQLNPEINEELKPSQPSKNANSPPPSPSQTTNNNPNNNQESDSEEPAVPETTTPKSPEQEQKNNEGQIPAIIEEDRPAPISGFSINDGNFKSNNWLFKLLKKFLSILSLGNGGITGNAALEIDASGTYSTLSSQENITIEITNTSQEYHLEYYTTPAIAEETTTNNPNGIIKRVDISAPEPNGEHYKNLIAFTNIPKESLKNNKSEIKVLWLEESQKIPVKELDNDNDLITDSIEWVIPHLSKQSFIITTQADFGNGTHFNTTANASGTLILWHGNRSQIANTGFGSFINITGLVASYHFDNDSSYGENSTRIYDFSGLQNNGTAYNGVVMNASGKIKGAASFDGVNDYAVASGTILDTLPNNQLTVSAWFKHTTTSVGGVDDYIINKGRIGGGGYGLYIDTTANKVGFLTNDGSWDIVLSDNGGYNDNLWHQATGVWNGTTNVLYVDGVLQSASTSASSPTMDSTGLAIGVYYDPSPFAGSYFNGSIDEVAIFNRTLSATEVLTVYNTQKDTYPSSGEYLSVINDTGGSSSYKNFSWSSIWNQTNGYATDGSYAPTTQTGQTNYSGLVAWYRFNNELGENSTNIIDWSGQANNATALNGAIINKTGMLEGGAQFEGTNDLFNMSSLPISGTGSFSIFSWVRTLNISNRKSIVSLGANSANNDGVYLFINSNNQVQTDLTNIAGPSSSATVTDGLWHFVGVVNNGGTIQIYVDGAASGSSQAMSPNIASGGDNNKFVGVARSSGSIVLPYNGSIDEVQIYNRALSTSEISNLYNIGIVGKQPAIGVRSCSTATCANTNWTGKIKNLLETGQAEIPSIIDNSTGLVLLYHFNNDSTYGENSSRIYDFSGLQNNGTAINGVVMNASGKIRGAGTFDGINDLINVSDSNILDLGTGDFSLSTWIMTESNASNNLAFVTKRNSGGQEGFYWGSQEENRILFYCAPETGCDTTTSLSSNITFRDGKWHNLAITRTSNSTTFYFDGIVAGTSSGVDGDFTNTNNLYVGKDNQISDAMNGSIDELAIWNRSLSASEIYNLYLNGQSRFFTTSPVQLTNVSSNRYFQHKVMFETTNRTYTPWVDEIKTNYETVSFDVDTQGEFNNGTYFNTTANSSGTLVLQHGNRSQIANNGFGNFINTTGLIASYHFDNESVYSENATNVYDFSGLQNNATNIGGVITNSTGKIKGSFSYDGVNDWTNASSFSDNVNITAGTYATWVYKASSATAVKAIFEARTSADMLDGDGQFGFGFRAGVGSGSFNSPSLPINKWTHVALTYDKAIDTMVVYVNGASIGSNTSLGAVPLPTGVRIGNDVFDSLWNGSIDEFSVWNRSLSAGEISNLYETQKDNYPVNGEYLSQINNTGTISNWSQLIWSSPWNQTNGYAIDGSYAPTTQTGQTNYSGLVAWYRFNNELGENQTKIIDWSGQANNATAINGSLHNSSGKLEGARTFDGVNDYLNTGYTAAIGTGEFTESVWFKTGISQLGSLITKRSGAPDYTQLELMMANDVDISVAGGKIVFYENHYSGGYQTRVAITAGSYNDGQWHQAVGVRNSTSTKIYVDGQLQMTNETTVTPYNLNNTQPIFIGALGDLGVPLTGYYFNGSIDDVQIYNRSLSASEISNLYEIGIVGKQPTIGVRSCSTANCSNTNWTGKIKNLLETGQVEIPSVLDSTTGLVALYHFNNESAYGESNTAAHDFSGLGNDLTIYNQTRINNTGKIRGGVTLDGINDYIRRPYPTATSVPAYGSKTLSAWVYKGEGGGGRLAESWCDGALGCSFLFTELGGYARDTNGDVYAVSCTSAENKINEWYHITLTLDGTVEKCYVNGVENGTGAFSFNNINAATEIVIGSFNGSIDELAIWNRSLSATEIYNLYLNGQSRFFTTSPVALTNLTSNRYLQYKVMFETTNRTYTPWVDNVDITHLTSGEIGCLTWNGSVSTNWSNENNWQEGNVPDTNSCVIINGAYTNPPKLSIGTTIYNLSIGKSATSLLTLEMPWGNSLNITQNLIIGANGKINHTANTNAKTYNLNITVGGNLTIEGGGTINVDGAGYSKNNGPGASGGESGSCYGGRGELYVDTGLCNTYGSITSPLDFGSGSVDSFGGGLIIINVTNIFNVSGAISSSGVNTNRAGGAGGGILISAGSMLGNGTIDTDGVNGISGRGDGGGGRIAIYLNQINNTGSVNISSRGGITTSEGAAGTIYIKKSGQTYGELHISNGAEALQDAVTTNLDSNMTYNFDIINITRNASIELSTGAILNLTNTTLIGDSQPGSRIIINGTKNSGNLTIPNHFNITGISIVQRGSQAIEITTNNLNLRNGAIISHLDNSAGITHRVNLTIIGNLTIDSGATINVDGLGYDSGSGPGVAAGEDGASHGGMGGEYDGTGPLKATYGSITNPTDFGSGAGGGNGGGAILINVTKTLNVTGTISASDGGLVGLGRGQGSAGSVLIYSENLIGNGTIDANGRSDGTGRGSGGGGRIAIYALVGTTTDNIKTQAYGGSASSTASPGTIYIKTANKNYGTITINNNGFTPSTGSTTLINQTTNYNFDVINITGAGYLEIGSNITSIIINENLWLSAGTIADSSSGNNIYLRGNMSTDSGSSVIFTSSTTSINGTSMQQVGLSVSPNRFYKLNINNTKAINFTSYIRAYDFDARKAGTNLTFAAGKTNNLTVTNSITIKGNSSSNIIINSTNETNWFINAPVTQSINYLTVRHSNASIGSTIIATRSTDAGQNTNWNFTEFVLPLIEFTAQTPANASNINYTNSIFVGTTSSDNLVHHSVTADFNRSLIGWWRFNDEDGENSTYIIDKSTYSNNATTANGSFINTTGKLGGGAQLDGINDNINVGNGSNLNITNAITVSAWVYPKTNGTQTIAGRYKHYNAPFSLDWILRLDNQQGAFWIGNNTGYSNSQDYTITPLNQWVYLTGTWNGSNTIIYVNGVQKNSTYQANMGSTNVNTYIGASQYAIDSATEFFNGSIDDLQIYSRALSATEIAALYNASTTQYSNNFTNLQNGNYTFTAYAQDLAGNINVTENRTVQIVNYVDEVKPQINFTNPTPTSGSTQAANTFIINVSSSDNTNNHSVTVDFNRTLVGWWRFNNESGDNSTYIIDRSTYANNGTTYNGAFTNSSGRLGGGAQFDGIDDHLKTPANDIYKTQNFTLSMWVYPKKQQNTITTLMDLNHSSGPSGNWVVQTEDSNGSIYYLAIWNGTTFDYSVTQGLNLTQNSWQLINYVKSGTSLIGYKDGAQIYSRTLAIGNVAYDNNPTLLFGKFVSGEDRYFNGSIDDVQVYSRALSATEIAALYNASTTQYTNNFTNLQDGTYNFTAYAQDWSGNINVTENRTVTIITSLNNWVCTSTTYKFNNASCWSLGRVPIAGDDVVFNASGNAPVNITNNTMPQNLNSFTVSTDYSGSLNFWPLFAQGNWTGRNDGTQLWNVTQNITIMNGTSSIWGDYLHSYTTGFYGNISNDGHGQEWRSINGNITIGSAATLDGSGLGFSGENVGPGGGAGTANSEGANYGGWGTKNYDIPYGNASAPTSLGSASNSAGGAGIKLHALSTSRIEGTILMRAADSGVGSGSGGSIWIKANKIEGSGMIDASSLGTYITGSGGRVRLEYANNLSYNGTLTLWRYTGTGFFGGGEAGTLTFTNNTWPGNWDLTGNIGLLGGDYGEGNTTNVLGNFNTRGYNISIFGDCYYTMTVGPTCYNKTSEGRGVWINASGNITIEKNSILYGTSHGFTVGPGYPGANGGASHGGRGRGNSPGTYGNEIAPTALGSGSNDGGTGIGGGAIILQSDTNTVTINGSVLMTTWGYGASGGSIYVKSAIIKGNGFLDATGAGGNCQAGGGGRIAMQSTKGTNFSGTIWNKGGNGAACPGFLGDGGTVFINSTIGIIGFINISTVGGAGYGQATINLTAPYLNLTSGNFNAYNYGNITINYTNCQSRFTYSLFNPEPPIWQTSCTTDFMSPNISFVSPTPANGSTFTQSRSVYVNVSSRDNYRNHSVTVDFNRSLVGWWRFNNESGDNSTYILDRSTYANNATTINGSFTNATGRLGGGAQLDGTDDYLSIGTNNLPYGTSSKTMCGWAATKSTAASVFGWIAAYGTPDTSQSFFIGRYGADLYAGGYGDDLILANYWSVGVWNHLCLTYNGTTAVLYSNGASINSTAKSWNTIESVARIGRQTNTAAEYWNGSIDDVQIYSRALTATEVASLYNASTTQYSNNFTNLQDGNYNFTAYSQDLAGNINVTENRTVTILLADSESPTINFTNPTPASGTTYTNMVAKAVYVNVSSSDNKNNHSVTVDFNRTLVGWWRFNNESGDNSTYILDRSTY
ncbi:MAG: LamG domain-containing protein, partial [Nanoarchaeota archaeon]